MRYLPAAILGLFFLGLYFAAKSLHFPIQKDELHFWPSSLVFSRSLLPSLESLRSYNDLNTPVPFVVFGITEYLFGLGIWAGRLINLLLCYGTCLVFFYDDKRTDFRRAFWPLVGFLAFPYFYLVATHLYTEAIAVFFTLFGMSLSRRHRPAWAAICFVLAISSRQYMVAFPVSLAVFHLVQNRQKRSSLFTADVVWPAASALSLLAWFAFFGGPAPRAALAAQVVETSRAGGVLPQNAGYFLACIGAYFVVPQWLFRRQAKQWMKSAAFIPSCLLLVLTALAFWFFPPLRNPTTYPFAEMGYLDKVCIAVFGAHGKVGVFYALAVSTLIFFRSFSVPSLLVWVHVPLMMKAHIAWDKYALALLCVLWWLDAKQELILGSTRKSKNKTKNAFP